MVKTFSISDNVALALENHAKENHCPYSKVVEAALVYYLTSNIATPSVRKVEGVVVPRGQRMLFDQDLK